MRNILILLLLLVLIMLFMFGCGSGSVERSKPPANDGPPEPPKFDRPYPVAK